MVTRSGCQGNRSSSGVYQQRSEGRVRYKHVDILSDFVQVMTLNNVKTTPYVKMHLSVTELEMNSTESYIYIVAGAKQGEQQVIEC